jgi:hypothetical protein
VNPCTTVGCTNTSWATAGVAVDEWNPAPTGPYTNNSAAAAAGYTMGKKRWPWGFIAGWVTGQDQMYTSLMLERTFDLAIIEGYSFNPESGGACGKKCFFNRLQYAREAGYIDRTINCYGMTVPKSAANPDGFTVESMCALISETQDAFPEMPGLAFYGHNLPVNASSAEWNLIRGISACAEKLYPDSWTPPEPVEPHV